MNVTRCTLAAVVAAATVAGALAIALVPATAEDSRTDIALAAESSTDTARTVDLAEVVAAWPDSFVVTGTKSEPFYVEHITIRRSGARFELTIDVRAQGTEELGVQHSVAAVDPGGTIARLSPCPPERPDCASDSVRGFLSTASLVAAAREGRLPETGVIRAFSETEVICVSDAALHPGAVPGVSGVDPCFSLATGAVLAHWSAASAAFTAATLAPDFVERIPGDD